MRIIGLAGWSGSGKTTLLNHLLKQPELANTAVLINEFGDIGLDHLLVEKLDETTSLLASGCICCSVRGDLAKALRDQLPRIESGAITWLNTVQAGQLRYILVGVALMLLMIFRPQGVLGNKKELAFA